MCQDQAFSLHLSYRYLMCIIFPFTFHTQHLIIYDSVTRVQCHFDRMLKISLHVNDLINLRLVDLTT